MNLYFIAGEASGDARGAELMRALADLAGARGEAAHFFGAGGPQMRALAPEIQDWSGEAVVGLWDVLKKYGYFLRQFNAMQREIAERKPDAVVLIDYPGFNLRMAEALNKVRKRNGAGPRIVYYVSPQVWAWNRKRIPKMARILDLMLCLFPFEKALYERSGLKTVFVGHPMLDSLAAVRDPDRFPREEALVGLFPGSRAKEVQRIFPVLLRAAGEMRRSSPGIRFEAAAASESLAKTMHALAARFFTGEPPVAITVGASHQLMQRATVGMVASGTATLESAFFEMPFAIVYRVAPLTWWVGKRLVRVPHLGMVNILAGKEIVPEFLQDDADPASVADEMLSLLNTPEKRRDQVGQLRQVVSGLGSGEGAAHVAAQAILAELGVTA